MLDEYKDEQPIVYKILKNSLNKNKYSHAYLFEKNNYIHSNELIFAFVKSLLCPNKYTNNNLCNDCIKCNKIDNNANINIEIINPDGMFIKKEQLEKLQIDFSKKSIDGNKKIYIINEVEKLNTSAANSILKFLEEPEENIIAILITDNIYQLLDTIISRCQIISFKKYEKCITTEIEKLKNILNEDEEIIEKIKDVSLDFINKLEENIKDTFLYTNKLWHSKIKTRNEYLIGYNIILLYYKDIINKKLNRKLEIFEDNDNISKISEKNSINDLIKKIKKINELIDYIKINANQNLLLDKLIIEIGDM